MKRCPFLKTRQITCGSSPTHSVGRFFFGREIRMVELKERIRELEENISELSTAHTGCRDKWFSD